MWAVSTRFLAQLREPHVVAVSVDLLPASGGDAVPVNVAGGSVTGDRSSQVRRTCSIELAAAAAELADLPFGAYLDVRRGVRFGDGTVELARLGLFRVDGVRAAKPSGAATLTGSDRMAQVRDEPLLAPFAAGGAIASAAIVDLVDDVFAGLVSHVSTIDEPVLADVTYTGDRARAVAELARSIDAEAYFDAVGELVVEPAAAGGPPVWLVDAGTTGVLLEQAEGRDRAGAANGVLVRGQPAADEPPLEVLVVDDDPSSPTFYGGPFGRVVVVLENVAVQDVDQATALGEAELARRLGLTRTLQLVAAPNPALEPGDPVEVLLADGTLEQAVLERVSIPLDAVGAVTVNTRSSSSSPAGGFAVVAGADAWQALRGAAVAA